MFTILLAFSTALAAPDYPMPPSPPDMDDRDDDDRGGGGHDREDRGDEGERLMKHFSEIAKRLGLSAEQKSGIEKLYYDSKSTGIDLKAKADKARLDLERTMLSDTVDEKAAMKAFDATAAAETEVRRNDLRLMLGVRKALTPEQWSQLKEMRESGKEERRQRRDSRSDQAAQPPQPPK